MRLIDAEAFKKQLEESYEYTELSEVVEMLDNAPTVELDESVIQEVLNKRCMTAVSNEYLIALHGSSKRPHGTWIERTDRITLNTYYECSNCNEPWTTIEGTPWDNGMNFCPNCGADMRQEGKNEV